MPKNYADLMNLEMRFEEYLRLVGLKKEELAPVRLTELRMAFMGGFGSALVLMVQDLDGLDELTAQNSLAYILVEVDKYWKTASVTPFPELIPS